MKKLVIDLKEKYTRAERPWCDLCDPESEYCARATKQIISDGLLEEDQFLCDQHFHMQDAYPKYRRVPVPMPHCPRCKEQLRGNNSMISPWECSCGVWKSSWSNPLRYTITSRLPEDREV